MIKNDSSKFKKFFSWFNIKKKDKTNRCPLENNKIINKNSSFHISQHKHENITLNERTDNIKDSEYININSKNKITSSLDFKKKGIFLTLVNKLSKTKKRFGLRIRSLFLNSKIDDTFFENISEQLLISDVGLKTTDMLIKNLKKEVYLKSLTDNDKILYVLKENMINILKKVEQPLSIIPKKPFSILIVGVNGVGKTSVIGKLTHIFKNQGKSVMLAAGDTFRAAAIDQLKILGEKTSVPVISQKCGVDPASVIYDAFQAAKSKNVDVLIADTAGRLHNKVNLMRELKKIKRVMKKLDSSAPNEVMLVLDSCIGQNSINQVNVFNEELGITGLIITKLDGTSKGGVIFPIADQLSIPIRYISFGEKISDMHYFNSENFVRAIF
ncbi:MAG: signal recognition particle-docking protein FtsY [Buchnera aphidicola (Floraphis choui)]